MKARFIRKAKGFTNHSELFRLERTKTENGVRFDYIVVSTLECAFDTGLPETYIFPANSNGKVVSWGELEGSFQGAMDISKALRDGGYEVVDGNMYEMHEFAFITPHGVEWHGDDKVDDGDDGVDSYADLGYTDDEDDDEDDGDVAND